MAFDITDPDTKLAIDTAIKTATEAAQKVASSAEAGLAAKNSELLEKLAKGKLTEEEQKQLETDRLELDEFRKTQISAEEERALKAGEFDKLKEQIVKKHGTEIETEKGISAKLKAALEVKLIDAEAILAISAAKGSTTILLPHVKAQLKVVEQDGVFVARVVDSAGAIRIGDDKGTPMSIDQLVAEMKANDTFAPVFEGTGASGGGANGGTGGNKPPAGEKTMSRKDFNELGVVEKADFMKKGGKLVNV